MIKIAARFREGLPTGRRPERLYDGTGLCRRPRCRWVADSARASRALTYNSTRKIRVEKRLFVRGVAEMGSCSEACVGIPATPTPAPSTTTTLPEDHASFPCKPNGPSWRIVWRTWSPIQLIWTRSRSAVCAMRHERGSSTAMAWRKTPEATAALQ